VSNFRDFTDLPKVSNHVCIVHISEFWLGMLEGIIYGMNFWKWIQFMQFFVEISRFLARVSKSF
jgi:hypothetical protein